MLDIGARRRKLQHTVTGTGDKQRRLVHDTTAPWPEQLPRTAQIAVPVQATPEAGALEFTRVIADVFLGEPCRQAGRLDRVAEKALARSQGAKYIALRTVARTAEMDAPNGRLHITLQFRLGLAGLLEILHVEVVDALLFQSAEKIQVSGWGKRDTHAHHRTKNIRAQHGGVPRHGCPPVVANDHGLLLAQCPNQLDHVSDKVQQGVLGNVRWRVRGTVTAHVRGDGAVACLRQCRELVAPGVPGFRETVAKQHQGTQALLCHPHGYVVDVVLAERRVAHSLFSLACRSMLPLVVNLQAPTCRSPE